MVRVHVGDDDPQDGKTFQLALKKQFPLGARLRRIDAAVHDAPTGYAVELVTQQPHIDVVQRKRQRHADPLHARCHLDAAP